QKSNEVGQEGRHIGPNHERYTGDTKVHQSRYDADSAEASQHTGFPEQALHELESFSGSACTRAGWDCVPADIGPGQSEAGRSLTSATRYSGRCFASTNRRATYSPSTPIDNSCMPPK